MKYPLAILTLVGAAAWPAALPARAETALAACDGGGVVADSAALPRLERCELIADDALQPRGVRGPGGSSAAIDNIWGGHQLRIATDRKDVVHALYLRGVDGKLQWRLMKRTRSGTWQEEATGWTTDDVNLVRDARSDAVHVFSWVASVPTVSDSPAFDGRPLPGDWQVMDIASRHYGAVGIAPDGTACLKVSFERQTLPTTSDTDLRYVCGTYDGASASWKWLTPRVQAIGPRHAYDYLFPGADGGRRFVSVAQRDQHKNAAGVPNAGNAWVFNGVRLFAGEATSPDGWVQRDLAEPVETVALATRAPQTLQVDALVDSKRRVWSAYRMTDPNDPSAWGLYLVVADTAGRLLYRARLGELPNYGTVRLVEDASGQFWLLWSNKGKLKTQLVLYPLEESERDGQLQFVVGRASDLSASFAPYALDGMPLIAAVRGGTSRRNVIDGLMFMCTTPYDGTPYDTSRCYQPEGRGQQRALHFRIRLRD